MMIRRASGASAGAAASVARRRKGGSSCGIHETRLACLEGRWIANAANASESNLAHPDITSTSNQGSLEEPRSTDRLCQSVGFALQFAAFASESLGLSRRGWLPLRANPIHAA